MQFLYSKHIPLIEEMIAKAQEKVIDTNPKDTFNMGFHAIPSMAQVRNQSTSTLSTHQMFSRKTNSEFSRIRFLLYILVLLYVQS